MAKASEAQGATPRRDPYEVLGVPKDAKDDQIKSAYRKLALKYHPDKNADNPQASERFKEVAYAYSILVDPDKRRQYDAAGFAAVDSDDMELDLSSLSTVHTVVAALFSKLGVPIKTLVAPQVMEEAMMGAVHPRPLTLFKPVSDKVEKQGAHFYDVTVTPEQAKGGIAVRVVSSTASKFKLLYFEQDVSGGLSLALQEDSAKCGKLTAAGLYFLNFQVYRLDPLVNAMAVVKDPESALFKRLDGLQPTEMISLQGGNHIFAVYGDNFFKSATYTIEAVAVPINADAKEKLKEVEAEILKKRDELKAFESEYKEAVTKYAAAQLRYAKEKQALDELLSRREKVYEQFSSSVGLTVGVGNGGTSPREGTGSGPTSPQAEPSGKGHCSGHSTKKKWWRSTRLATRSTRCGGKAQPATNGGWSRASSPTSRAEMERCCGAWKR